MKKFNADEKFKIKGEYQFFNLAPWVKKKSEVVNKLRKYVKSGKTAILDELKRSGAVIDVKTATNLIPTTGRNVLARLLSGDTTYSGEVDYGAVGDGDTAFTNASTKLNNEIYRLQAAFQGYDDNITYIDWFIESGDTPNDTFEEFGAFIDGTGAADSGQAWSLLITGGWVKSGSIYVSAKYTINN